MSPPGSKRGRVAIGFNCRLARVAVLLPPLKCRSSWRRREGTSLLTSTRMSALTPPATSSSCASEPGQRSRELAWIDPPLSTTPFNSPSTHTHPFAYPSLGSSTTTTASFSTSRGTSSCRRVTPLGRAPAATPSTSAVFPRRGCLSPPPPPLCPPCPASSVLVLSERPPWLATVSAFRPGY